MPIRKRLFGFAVLASPPLRFDDGLQTCFFVRQRRWMAIQCDNSTTEEHANPTMTLIVYYDLLLHKRFKCPNFKFCNLNFKLKCIKFCNKFINNLVSGRVAKLPTQVHECQEEIIELVVKSPFKIVLSIADLWGTHKTTFWVRADLPAISTLEICCCCGEERKAEKRVSHKSWANKCANHSGSWTSNSVFYHSNLSSQDLHVYFPLFFELIGLISLDFGIVSPILFWICTY